MGNVGSRDNLWHQTLVVNGKLKLSNTSSSTHVRTRVHIHMPAASDIFTKRTKCANYQQKHYKFPTIFQNCQSSNVTGDRIRVVGIHQLAQYWHLTGTHEGCIYVQCTLLRHTPLFLHYEVLILHSANFIVCLIICCDVKGESVSTASAVKLHNLIAAKNYWSWLWTFDHPDCKCVKMKQTFQWMLQLTTDLLCCV